MKARLRKAILLGTLVALVIVPALPAHADFLFNMRLDVTGYPTSFKVCATASTGTAAATDITIALDVEGVSATLIGAQPLVAAPSQTALGVTSVSVCSGTWNLGTAPTGSVHIATHAFATNLLASSVGSCEGSASWLLGAAPIVVKGC